MGTLDQKEYLENNVSTLKSSIQERDEQLTKISSENKDFVEEINSLKNELNKLASSLSKKDEKLDDFLTKRENDSDKVASLQSEIFRFKEVESEHKLTTEKHLKEIEDLTVLQVGWESTAADLKTQKISLKQELEAVNEARIEA